VIKVVKTITIVLGIMIFIALGMLGYGFYSSNGAPQDEQRETDGTVPKPQQTHTQLSMDADVGGVTLGQPQGSIIIDVKPQGTWVFVTVRGGGLADRVLIVDLAKRRVVGTVTVDGVNHAVKP